MRCESMDMSTLPTDWAQELNHFKRQYLQLQVTIKYPERQYLKHEEFQNELYIQIFCQKALKFHPPQRYQFRVLKELMKRIEDSITDWEEELEAITRDMYFSKAAALTSILQQQSISDDLMECFSSLLITRMPAEAEAAQEKSYVTYSITSLSDEEPPTITISESRNLLGGSGTTGFRTWEASLQMGDFLTSPSCPPDLSLDSKIILELGCGTGYLSVLCSKYLKTAHITATDGFDTVVDDLDENFLLNDLDLSSRLQKRLFKWGKSSFSKTCRNDNTFVDGKAPDIILGADVTYDAAALPALCETLEELLVAYPKTQILLASTVRNEDTFKKFLDLCEEHNFNRDSLAWEPRIPEKQKGPFYRIDMPVRMSRITARK